MEQADWQKWFEAIWADREEHFYRQFFGDLGPGIYNLTAKTFADLDRPDPDPRYLFHGVFACPPAKSRTHWTYITSGMSNPWGESPETTSPERYSGLGFEFLLCTRAESPWAIGVLHWLMAVQLLVASGDVQGHLLEIHDRIPLGGILPRGAPASGPGLAHLLVAEPAVPLDLPRQFSLASGKVDLMLLIGITTREADFARTQDSAALLNLLNHQSIFPITDPNRLSLL